MNDDYFDESAVAQSGARPARSPGLRLASVPRTPPVSNGGQYAGTEGVSPIDENAPISFAGQQTGGVKRTKSLMQKIKSMVRTREDESPPRREGVRAQSFSQPPRSARIQRDVRVGSLPDDLVTEEAYGADEFPIRHGAATAGVGAKSGVQGMTIA